MARPETVAEIEPIDPRLIAEPIEFIFAEHYRQRAMLNLIEQVADGELSVEARRRVAGMALGFLARDLALHVLDEEQDLFPLLQRRARPGDRMIAVLAQFAAEHAADEMLAQELAAGLAAMAGRGPAAPSPEFRACARLFTQAQRRHLAWENAVVLPLARERLTAADLRDLARRMAARRGLRRPRRAG
jgi:hemerythrin-like domain-containing protein